ncbi:MAG TPA: DUF4199 domain-containing protein [Puia sp.]|nr:DUF4199 domain-containing protein [Puia sp.]
MEKKVTSHVTKGLIIALVLFVIDIIAGFAHFKFATWYRWLPLLIFLAAIIWACINFAAQKNHDVTFGNIFGHGFKTSVVVACITIIFTLLSIYLIFPETKDLALDEARKQMEAKGNLSQDVIDQSLEFTKKMFVPFAIIGVIFVFLLGGAIASLIGAAIPKKNPQTPFEKQP